MRLWFGEATPEATNDWRRGTIVEHLDVRITAVGDDWLEGRMPIGDVARTSDGQLHGGAAAVLAETLGSYAANLVLDPRRQVAVGQEITAAYLRPARTGTVTGRAYPLVIGPESQVWSIEVRDDGGDLVSLWRLRIAVIDARPA